MLDYVLRQCLLLLEPVGFTWGCLVLLCIAFLLKRRWRSATATFGLIALMYLCGATGFPDALVRSLEQPYAGVNWRELPAADAVVMLGGGIEPSRFEVGGFHLTRAGDRLLMAVEMIRRERAHVLVLGGGGAELDQQVKVEAELVEQWVADWKLVEMNGPRRVEVVSLGKCRDTHDEAVRVKHIADERGWHGILLVTSAAHMQRAAATFRLAGVKVTEVPCNFISTLSTARQPWTASVPRYEGFEKISVWLHEQIGWLEYRRKGWL